MQHTVQFIRDGKPIIGQSNARIYLKHSTGKFYVFIDKVIYELSPTEYSTFQCIKKSKSSPVQDKQSSK